jgi:hypothetical protein
VQPRALIPCKQSNLMHRTVDRPQWCATAHPFCSTLTAIHYWPTHSVAAVDCPQARSRSIGLAKGEVLGSQELTRTSAHFKHVVRDALDGHAEPSDALDADNTALVRKLRHCGAGLLGSLARRPNCTPPELHVLDASVIPAGCMRWVALCGTLGVAWQQARLISNIDHLVIQLGLKQQKTMELVEIVNEIKEAIKYSQRPSLHPAHVCAGSCARSPPLDDVRVLVRPTQQYRIRPALAAADHIAYLSCS